MSSFGVAQTEIDCGDFKTGKFIYTAPGGGEVSIKRTKKKQIERYNNEHQKFIFEINWLDDCTYDLTLVNAKGLPKEKKQEIIGSTLHCIVTASRLGHYEVTILSGNKSQPTELTIYSFR